LRSETVLEFVRLDVWLDVSCLFPTRSQAKAACEGGKIDVNGASGKSHREIRVGDRLTVTRAPGVRRELVVQGLADRSIPKAQARALYEDVTPLPRPEVAEARRLDRLLAPKADAGRPDRRERRERRKQKGW
jgi:ribosome-associated heat shock protein Hsp15